MLFEIKAEEENILMTFAFKAIAYITVIGKKEEEEEV